MILHGRTIFPGRASGETLVSKMGISFYGGIDPDTGIITEDGHDLAGHNIAGKVLVFPSGKGSTVGSYILYRLHKNGHAPLGIINADCETIIAIGCIIGEIPCIDQVDLSQLQTGMLVVLDSQAGWVEIII